MSTDSMTIPVWASATYPAAGAKIKQGRLRSDPEWRRRMVQHVVAGTAMPSGPPHGDIAAADLVHEAMGRLCPYVELWRPLLWAVESPSSDAPGLDVRPEWSLPQELVRSWRAWNRPGLPTDTFVPPDRDALEACQGVVLVLGLLASPAVLHEALVHLRRTGPARPVSVLAFAVHDASVFLTSRNQALVTFEPDGSVSSAWAGAWEQAPKMW
jgi:hypothetical protein